MSVSLSSSHIEIIDEINKIEEVVPSSATSFNQLADKNYVDNKIADIEFTDDYAKSISLTIDSSTYVVTAQLKDQNGNNLGAAQTIDLPLESVVVSGSYDNTTKNIVLTLKDNSTISFSVADLISGLQSEITTSNKLSSDLVDDTNRTHKFVTSAEKTKWNQKQDALTFDSRPTQDSNNPVTSDGVFRAIDDTFSYLMDRQDTIQEIGVEVREGDNFYLGRLDIDFEIKEGARAVLLLVNDGKSASWQPLSNKPLILCTYDNAELVGDEGVLSSAAIKPLTPEITNETLSPLDWNITKNYSILFKQFYHSVFDGIPFVVVTGTFTSAVLGTWLFLADTPDLSNTGAVEQVKSNWLETDTTSAAYIQNKPTKVTSEAGTEADTYTTEAYVLERISQSTANFVPNTDLTRANLISIIGNATSSLDGIMSAQDKTNLNTLMTILGTETGDSDTFVNTIREVLAIFNNYPEGADLVTALSNKVAKGTVYTPEGSVSADFTPTPHTHTATFTGSQATLSYSTSFTPSGGIKAIYGSNENYTPEGTISQITPSGTISEPQTSITTSGDVYAITSVGTLPTATYTTGSLPSATYVSGTLPSATFTSGTLPSATFVNGNLPSITYNYTSSTKRLKISFNQGTSNTFTFNSGTLPTLSFSAGALATFSFNRGTLPTFSFSAGTLPSRDLITITAQTSAPTFTGTPVTPTFTGRSVNLRLDAALHTISGSITYTPQGSISVSSATASGTISATFSGTGKSLA